MLANEERLVQMARFYGALDVNEGRVATWAEFGEEHDMHLFRRWLEREEPMVRTKVWVREGHFTLQVR